MMKITRCVFLLLSTLLFEAALAQSIDLGPIEPLLKDPYSAKFSSVSQHRDGTICGLVNAKNSYGAYVGIKPFAIPSDGMAYIVDDKNGERFDFDCLGGKQRYTVKQLSRGVEQDKKCPDAGEMAFSCRVSDGKELLLCKVPGGVFYSFGPRARPELTLSRLKRDVTYTTEIMGGKSSQRTVVMNGDYKYEVFGGDTQGVNVSRKGNSLEYFACNPSSVFDRMEILDPSASK